MILLLFDFEAVIQYINERYNLRESYEGIDELIWHDKSKQKACRLVSLQLNIKINTNMHVHSYN